MNLILASDNLKKVSELQQLLGAATGVTIIPQGKFNVVPAAENGLTYVENALIKARNACKHTGLPAIADDSGLEVDALNGAPGIYSARYSGIGATGVENNNKLLAALADIAEPAQRRARFRCLMVYLRHAADPAPIICEGVWEGRILFAPQGNNGFGYDPIFYVPTHDCAAAMLPPEIKNQISHRGQALVQLLRQLSPLFCKS